MSMACAADLLALMTLGPNVAMVTASTSVLFQCTWRVRRSQPLYRAAFSVASVAITVQAAGWIWRALNGNAEAPTLTTMVVPLIAISAGYFLVNTGLVATAVGLTNRESPIRAWYREFFWSGPSYFLSGAAAGVISLIITNDAYILLPLAFVPLYVSYRAYHLSLERIEAERRHAAELAQALDRATQSEAALAEEKERLVLESSRLIVTVQTIRDGVMTVDRDGAIVLMNNQARKLSALAPTPRIRGPSSRRSWRSACPGRTPRMPCAGCGTAQSSGCATMCRPTARSRWSKSPAPPRATPTANVAGGVWVLRDISHIARAEHERAKAAHLQSIGVLAGGLAHDVNNILMGIVGNLSLAESLVRPEETALATRLNHASAACARARGVTSQLLTFAKGGAPIKTTSSVRDLVVECSRFALSGSPVAPRFSIDDDLWAADVDLDQIGQVVHNLVLNALQAMPRGGVVDVALANEELAADAPLAMTGLAPGRYVRLTVQDQGHGIPPDKLDRIFDPYFTTKEFGSGLGLAITYSIVHAHGGAITVESQPGQGAQFTILLPASARPVVPEVVQPATVVRRQGGRVLLMDDDEMVAEVAEEMLQSLGYLTEATPSGEAAIERFRAAEDRGEPFDVVILDLTVAGGMGGAEAVGHIRNIRADVTIYVTSGYTDDSVLAHFRDYGFNGVLPKPFGVADLRRVLNAEQPARG